MTVRLAVFVLVGVWVGGGVARAQTPPAPTPTTSDPAGTTSDETEPEQELTPEEREALNTAYLTREFRPRVRDIRRCYERISLSEPSAAGRFGFEFEIDWEGHPATPTIVENEVGTALANCSLNAIRSWSFAPPPFGSITVRKSFLFAPSSDANGGSHDGDPHTELSEEAQMQVQEWLHEAQRWTIRGEFGRAIGVLLRARSQAPGLADVHLMLYSAYLGLGNSSQAAASLSTFLELEPEDPWADRYREDLTQLEAGELPAPIQR